MPTSRAFAFNTGSTISGTEQVGSIAVNSGTTLSGNVVWWAGPDEELGYVIAQAVSGGTMTGANGQPAYLGFYRSDTLTNASFISLANYLAQGQQVFTSGSEAKTWLNSNGYWTSYVSGEFILKVSSGVNFSIGLTNEGSIYSWGNNLYGQLGNNSKIYKSIPSPICGAKKTFCRIIAAANSCFAIDKYGQIWAWGSNSDFVLGINGGLTSSRSTPVKVSGAAKTFCKLGANSSATFAIDNYGQVWGWGSNTIGNLGNNSTINRSTPVSVCGAKKTFCELVYGDAATSAAIDQYGQIWTWGSASQGGLGNNSTVSVCTPVSICGAKKTFCQVFNTYLGVATAQCALDQYGQLWTWGNNASGNLGDNSTIHRSTPVSVCGAKKTFCRIGGGLSNAALDKYGRIWVWGLNQNRTGGLGTASRSTPILLVDKTFCDLFTGDNVIAALGIQQRIWMWGSQEDSSFGMNYQYYLKTPKSICGLNKTFCKIDGKGLNVIAISNSGKLYSWGYNLNGQLGINLSGDLSCVQTPVVITTLQNKTFCEIFSSNASYGIDNTGLIWSWGVNTAGGLGNNSVTNFSTPISICGARKTFCKIVGGSLFALGLDKNGLIWSWGQGINGKLGYNSTFNRCTPGSICGALKTFCHIAASTSNGYGIDKYGQIWAWGAASTGRLGNNQVLTQANTPISICGAKKTFCKISAGFLGVSAIDQYGQIWGWAGNLYGQIGNNSAVSTSTPVSVCGARKTFCDIYVSGENVAAIDKYGQLWIWGLNQYGVLDSSTSYSILTPTKIGGSLKTFSSISINSEYAIGIDKNGLVWSWGSDTYGQQGRNYTFQTPMMICGI